MIQFLNKISQSGIHVDFHWEALTESEFIAKEIEGNHGSIMNTPNIQELALFILASMEKPQNKGVNVNTKYEI